MKTQFLGGAYVARSSNAAANRLVNAYPEQIPEGGKEPAALIGCPGLRRMYYLGDSVGIRGMIAGSDGKFYAVAGNQLWQVTVAFGGATAVGTLNSGSGPVSMADNGTQLAIVDGVAGYTWTFGTSTFATISDPDFPNGCTHIAYQDTYGIVVDPGTQTFKISASNDFTSWAALDFAAAEGDPDKALVPLVDHRELWIFGEVSTEVFYNSGNADFPFERVQGGYIEHGIAAVHSAVKLDNSVFWLAKNKAGGAVVLRVVGYQPQIISTHAVSYAIEQYGDVSDAYAYGYQQEGHAFYVLVFPSAGACWVFDSATSLWHERGGFADGEYTAYPVSCHAYFGGKNLVGHRDNGRIYTLELDEYDYDDQPRKVLRSWRIPFNEENEVETNELVIGMETGVGITTWQGSDPQMMLRVSKDGGHTWPVERWAPVGKIGERGRGVRWRRVACAADTVLEVSITDPVKVVMTGAYMDGKAL